MMQRMKVLGLAMVIGLGGAAEGAVLEFDDLYMPGEKEELPAGYGGFLWNGTAHWISYDIHDVSGYVNGTVGTVSIFNTYEDDLIATRVDGETFDLLGALMGAGWNIEQHFRVEGWLDGALVDSFEGVSSASGSQWFNFDLIGIDEFRFISGADGGKGKIGTGSGRHLVIDHLTYVVPEPGSLGLLVLGGLACLRRR